MDWKVILALVVTPIVSGFIAWLIVTKRVKMIRFGKLAIEAGSTETSYEGYLVEILLETARISQGVRRLAERRRREIKRYVTEWKDLVSQIVRDGFQSAGFAAGDLYKSIIFRYFHKVLDDLHGKIIDLAMDHCECNGFEDLYTDNDKEMFGQARAVEVSMMVHSFLDTEFIVGTSDTISQGEVIRWIAKHDDRLRDVWVRLYRTLVAMTIQEKSELIARGERIVAKGEGILSEARLDQLSKVLTQDLLEGI